MNGKCFELLLEFWQERRKEVSPNFFSLFSPPSLDLGVSFLQTRRELTTSFYLFLVRCSPQLDDEMEKDFGP